MFLLGTFVFAGLFVLYSTYDILKTEDKKKTKKGTLSSRGYTSREVNEARWPHTCSRPCAFEEKKIEKKKNGKKIRPTHNTPRNPQQPGDRVQLETTCEETHPTRSPKPSRFRRSWVCGNRPRTALAISKNYECYTH